MVIVVGVFVDGSSLVAASTFRVIVIGFRLLLWPMLMVGFFRLVVGSFVLVVMVVMGVMALFVIMWSLMVVGRNWCWLWSMVIVMSMVAMTSWRNTS